MGLSSDPIDNGVRAPWAAIAFPRSKSCLAIIEVLCSAAAVENSKMKLVFDGAGGVSLMMSDIVLMNCSQLPRSKVGPGKW
jgi:hypothetical protein